MVKIYVCKIAGHQHASKKDKEACFKKLKCQFMRSKRSLPEAVEKISTEASTTKDIGIKCSHQKVDIVVSDSEAEKEEEYE